MTQSVKAISGTRRAMREMADGTIRVQVDIDPRFRDDFFAMFPAIDMPVAIAPLVANFEQQGEPEKTKGGALSELAGMWCRDKRFWDFLEVPDEKSAIEYIRAICGVESRADIDHNPDAERAFQSEIRIPYMNYLRGDDCLNDVTTE